MTNNDSGLFSNLSFIDLIGLPLGMTMSTNDGKGYTVRGINSGAVSSVCNSLKNYVGPDNAPWDQLCQYLPNGTPLRVVSPQKYIALHSNAFSNYFTNYINSVWSKYSTQPLTIDSQGSIGKFQCTASGNNLNCAGGNRPFIKPSASNIFGCDGTFGNQGDNQYILAATARICAGLNRATLMMNGGKELYHLQHHTDSIASSMLLLFSGHEKV